MFSQAEAISGLEQIFPGCVIIAEEKSVTPQERQKILLQALAEGKLIVFLDPLDGSSFFNAGLPDWSISAAGFKNGQMLWGITSAPVHAETYTGEVGRGAYCNGEQIHCSQETRLKRLVGNLSHREIREGRFNQSFLESMQALWTTGSTAYALANLSAGHIGFARHPKQSFWDFAAALILVPEAGGFITNIYGNINFDMSGNRSEENTILAAANEGLYRYLIGFLQ